MRGIAVPYVVDGALNRGMGGDQSNMRQRFPAIGLTACALLALASTALAQEDDAAADTDLGASRVRTQLTGAAYFSDNFYNRPTNESSGYGTLLRPEAEFLKEGAKLRLEAELEAEYGMFSLPGSDDDYLDGAARLKLASQATLRNQLRLEGQFKHGHDAFGVDRTEDASARDADLDRWNRTTGALHYRYGAPGAQLNAEVGIATLEKRYVTNDAATEPLNYDSTDVIYTVFYNYSSKTAALIDFSRTDFSFDRPFGAVDIRGGELYRLRAGIKWLATGKTSGDVRAGYRRRLFDAGTADIEGVDWEAGVDWTPVPRSTLRLATARSEQESYTADARVIDIESISLDWKHNLTSRTRSTVGLEHLKADYDSSGRSDKILSAAVGLEHRLQSHLWAVGTIGMTQRDSSLALREYDRLNAFLGLRLGR